MKTRMKIAVAALLCMVAWFALSVQAQESYSWKQYDTESPFLIKYTGTGSATVTVVTATGITINDSGNETNVDATNTIATVMGLINACTNAAGVKNFSTQIWGGLAADTCTIKLLAASATVLTPGQWSTVVKWDTSVGLTADCVLSTIGPGDSVITPRLLTSIFGDPIGTGNVTLRVYNDGTSVFQKTYTSPVYVNPASGGGGTIITMSGSTDVVTRVTNTIAGITYTADATVEINEPVNIRLSAGKVAFVRATRATSATTTLGGIGAAVKD